MQQVPYNKNADKNIEIISKGAFLTTAANGKTNTMTIGWASISYVWQRPVFIVYVRPSRYTYELIEKSGEFTVSVPYEDMKMQLGFCGVKSGRTIDKIAALEFKTFPSKTIQTPALDIKGMHYECKILYKTPMDPNALDKKVQAYYPNGDYHTMYFAEILNTVEIA